MSPPPDKVRGQHTQFVASLIDRGIKKWGSMEMLLVDPVHGELILLIEDRRYVLELRALDS
jgi:hypothetical protein